MIASAVSVFSHLLKGGGLWLSVIFLFICAAAGKAYYESRKNGHN